MQITAVGLSHWFAGTPPLFAELGFQLDPGLLHGLTGPSGSGKSTLLSILAGWVVPQQGTVERVGVASVGWVFQNPVGVARRTALDHVALPLLARGRRRAAATAAAAALLAEFGLDAVGDRDYATLSGGEAQRLMLARAVAKSPDLLLVDEPTAQLDLTTADSVNQALGALSRRDMIVVVATHHLGTMAACDKIIDLTAAQPVSGHAD
ncbi:MAG: ATP-binding cassette domain-containing protein [Propionibacteriaceae bacterium]|jgi:ABC-type lipoprotein export system ATPase subunit|nr:ATP-binding cassette domain-containing protein [Propionibacteriaceae bacterium]